MVAEVVWLGLVCLLAPAITQYAGVRKKAEKGYNWITIAGLMFILAGAFDPVTVTFWATSGLTEIVGWGMQLFQIIGWIFVLVGVLSVLFESYK